jgi:hypothetical protein
LAPIGIFAFIVLTERAHDESRCPYVERTRLEAGADARVVEETRSCVEGIEERRFVLERGARRQLLGERRLPRGAFEPAAYTVTVTRSPEGEVQVRIRNQGHGEVVFREGT